MQEKVQLFCNRPFSTVPFGKVAKKQLILGDAEENHIQMGGLGGGADKASNPKRIDDRWRGPTKYMKPYSKSILTDVGL